MTTTAYLVPKTGLLVRHPGTRRRLPPVGEAVALDRYWHRRIADGDVQVQAPKRAANPKTDKPASRRGDQE
jgi:hypothetical protein